MNTITVVIETPKASAQKYNYDEKNKWFKLKKILPAGMVFPFDFGFIPGTKGGDGDPLDIVVISELQSFPGCVMDCRVIGAILAEQTEQGKTIRNDRLIAIAEPSKMFSAVNNIKDLPAEMIDELQQFFINYNKAEGKEFKPIKIINADEACKLIESSGNND